MIPLDLCEEICGWEELEEVIRSMGEIDDGIGVFFLERRRFVFQTRSLEFLSRGEC